MQHIEIDEQNKKAFISENLLICNSKMVQQLDYRWNQFYASLVVIYDKLERLQLADYFEESQ